MFICVNVFIFGLSISRETLLTKGFFSYSYIYQKNGIYFFSEKPHNFFCHACGFGFHYLISIEHHFQKYPSHNPQGFLVPPGEDLESEDDGTGTIRFLSLKLPFD